MNIPADTLDLYSETQFCTVAQLAADPLLPGIKESNMRAWIFQAEERDGSGGVQMPGNGLAPAIIRIGRKVLIDRREFIRWLENHRMYQGTRPAEQNMTISQAGWRFDDGPIA